MRGGERKTYNESSVVRKITEVLGGPNFACTLPLSAFAGLSSNSSEVLACDGALYRLK
jgi:hypothetical protein